MCVVFSSILVRHTAVTLTSSSSASGCSCREQAWRGVSEAILDARPDILSQGVLVLVDVFDAVVRVTPDIDECETSPES